MRIQSLKISLGDDTTNLLHVFEPAPEEMQLIRFIENNKAALYIWLGAVLKRVDVLWNDTPADDEVALVFNHVGDHEHLMTGQVTSEGRKIIEFKQWKETYSCQAAAYHNIRIWMWLS